MAAIPPASSPRLPSPPPMAEDQTGPISPGVSLFEDRGKPPGQGIDTGASRRIRPGTKAEDMAEGPPLIPLQDIDSAFQLTEHLKALYYHHTHPPESDTTHQISPEIAEQLARPPDGVDKNLYLYELARLLIQKTNAIIVALFGDSPPCSSTTCPEMRASEWQYLCAVHEPPKSCCAIDYCCHTLDWAASSLTSSKMFPSRLGLAPGGVGGGLDRQMKEITNIFRRVYRIFAHAWFQHREVFWKVEGRSGLYVLFKTVCDEYGIIQADNYTIPPEAEGLEATPTQKKQDEHIRPQVLKRDSEGWDARRQQGLQEQQPAGNVVLATGDTTKRHRHTMSDRATSVIHEEVEEEDGYEEKPTQERQETAVRELDVEELDVQELDVQELDEQELDVHELDVRELDGQELGEWEVGVAKTTGEAAGGQEPESEDEVIQRIKPSDTVRAVHELEELCGTEHDEKPAESTTSKAVHDTSGEPAVEAMDPEKAPAAGAEEAGKSVAD